MFRPEKIVQLLKNFGDILEGILNDTNYSFNCDLIEKYSDLVVFLKIK